MKIDRGSAFNTARVQWVVDFRPAGSRGKFSTSVEKFDLSAGAETLMAMLIAKGQEAHVRQIVTPARKPKAQRSLL
jgi:hypothetical protein